MRRVLFFFLFGLTGAATLISLGVWQVQRLAWKQEVIANIEARIVDAPIAIPDDISPDRDKYLPVTATGRLLPGDLRVLVSIKQVGPGYRVISPFETSDGRRILLDRGFVPTDVSIIPRATGSYSVTGNLHWPQETDSYTPTADLENNIWFARDVSEMAKALNTEPVLLIQRETSGTDTSVTPLPVDTAKIPNDHLQYAITWFSLAAIWLVMTAFFLRPARTKTES